MTTNFVLVHGEWHGAWSWQTVAQHLEEARKTRPIGEVMSIDLPGHGRRAAAEIRRIQIDQYVDAVVTPIQVKRLTQVILVGHSFAATFLPRVTRELGSAVARVVLIAGILPPEGQTAFDTLPPLMKRLVKTFRPAEKGVMLPAPLLRRVLCNNMEPPMAKELLPRLVPDPFMPWTAPVQRSGFPGSIPVTYVVLTQDRFVPPAVQRQYSQSIGTAEVVEIEAGHEALLTHPKVIGEVLLRYVEARKETPVAETSP